MSQNNPAESIRLEVKLKYKTATEFETRFAANVSAQAVFLKTPSPKPPGTPLFLDLKLADGTTVLAGSGRVLESYTRTDPAPGKPAGMLIGLSPADAASATRTSTIVAKYGPGKNTKIVRQVVAPPVKKPVAAMQNPLAAEGEFGDLISDLQNSLEGLGDASSASFDAAPTVPLQATNPPLEKPAPNLIQSPAVQAPPPIQANHPLQQNPIPSPPVVPPAAQAAQIPVAPAPSLPTAPPMSAQNAPFAPASPPSFTDPGPGFVAVSQGASPPSAWQQQHSGTMNLAKTNPPALPKIPTAPAAPQVATPSPQEMTTPPAAVPKDANNSIQFGRLELKKKAVIVPSQTESKIQHNLQEEQLLRNNSLPAPEQETAPVTEQESAPVAEQETAPVAGQEAAPALEQETAPVAEQETAPVTEQESAPTLEQEAAPVNTQAQTLEDDPFSSLPAQAFAENAAPAPAALEASPEAVQEALQPLPAQDNTIAQQADAEEEDDGGFSEQALITGSTVANDFFNTAPKSEASAFEPETTERVERLRPQRRARKSSAKSAIISVVIGAVAGLIIGIGLSSFSAASPQQEDLKRADLLSKTGRASEAIPLYRKILQAQPNLAAAQHNLGVALALNGEQEQADQALRDYLKLEKNPGEKQKVRAYLGE